jgi:Protein of unknown function (DUF2939)
MKWAAGICAAVLYLVWPYYTLLELGQAIQAADAPTINRLVDWDRLRPSLKAQLQAQLQNKPKTVTERDYEQKNPGLAALGDTVVLAFANSLIDTILTPEGIVRLVQIRGDTVPVGKTLQQPKPETRRPNADTNPQTTLWQRIRFAFFVSPIHFRLDLSEPNRGGAAGPASGAQPSLTVMLMFKGTEWQVSDLRLSGFQNLSTKMALAPK